MNTDNKTQKNPDGAPILPIEDNPILVKDVLNLNNTLPKDTGDIIKTAAAAINKGTEKKIKKITEQITQTLAKLWENDPTFRKSLDKLVEATKDLTENIEKIQEAFPELEEEEIRRLTIPQIKKLLEQIEQEQEQAKTEAAALLEQVIVNPVESVIFPKSRLDKKIWNNNINFDEKGEFSAFINSAGEESNTKALIYLSATADTNSMLKDLVQDPYDRRVALGAYSNLLAGNKKVTITAIHNAMGYVSAPNKDQRERIINSLIKILCITYIVVNTGENEFFIKKITEKIGEEQTNFFKEHAEAKTYKPKKGGYPQLAIVSHFLDAKLFINDSEHPIKFNNIESNTYLEFLGRSEIIDHDIARGQVTTVPKKLLNSPLDKNIPSIEIEDYFIDQISTMKNNKGYSRKMTYKTIFARLNIENDKGKKYRAKEKIRRLLDFYKKEKYIKNYGEDKRSITIIL